MVSLCEALNPEDHAYLACLSLLRTSEPLGDKERAELRQIFKLADLDGNGFIDAAELLVPSDMHQTCVVHALDVC